MNDLIKMLVFFLATVAALIKCARDASGDERGRIVKVTDPGTAIWQCASKFGRRLRFRNTPRILVCADVRRVLHCR